MKNHATALFYLALFSVLLFSATSAKAETIYRLLANTDGFTLEDPPPNDSSQFHALAGSRFKIVNDTGSSLVVLFTGGLPDSTSTDDIQNSTDADDIQDITGAEDIQDSTDADDIQNSTDTDDIQDSTDTDDIQDSTDADDIQDNTSADAIQDSTISTHVVEEVNYLISKEKLTEYRYELAFGFACGLLTTSPVKIQLCDGNMTIGTNLGAYAGWRVTLAHIPFTIIGSAGSAIIPISDAGADKVETKLGWTCAIGLLIEPISNYQIGILFGIDHLVGDARNDYPYQNEIWISFGIGFDFMN